MSEIIPGGRQRASSEGDILDDDDDDSLYPPGHGDPTNSGGHRKVLTTVDREGNIREGYYSDAQEDRRILGPSERRSKSRRTSFKSIKKLMNRVMKSSSSTNSLNEQDANPNSRVTWTPTLRRRHDSGNDDHDVRGSRRGKHDKSESTFRPLITESGFSGPKWDKTPVTVGLHNHGNTCFMNAILQCLSNTDSFVEYFVDGTFENDLRNMRNSRKTSVRVDVTEQLAVLVKCLWSNRYSADVSKTFKSVVGKVNRQYEGSSQHDAQEFLLWLLDRLHEDLNTNVKKKPKPLKNTAMRSDDELANEAQLLGNGSFVSHLFQALHRSSLTCPNCGKHSNTFDPYLCVSLPLPQKCPRPVFVNIVYIGHRQLKIGLRMNTFESVRDLRHRISTDVKIPESQMVLCQVTNNGFRTTYGDDQPLSDILETETVYVFETTPDKEPASASSRYETPYIQILLVHTERDAHPTASYRFGNPCLLRVPRDFTYKRLQKEILHSMGDAVKQDTFTQKGVLFRLRVVDSRPHKTYLPSDVEMPLYTQTVDDVLTFYGEDYGPSHMKLVAEWDPQTKDIYVLDEEEDVEEHASVHQMRISQHLSPSASLEECFTLYTQEEKLSGDDAWLCPHCKQQQQGTIKTLGLWSLPDILVIHLKRFKQVGMRRNKLNTLVSFPVENLNMTPHVVKRADSGQVATDTVTSRDDLVYDLFGVCNHYGNMNGGHYTAFCKNPIDSQWHEFDDTRVRNLPESQVTTKAAYLLFYQRRSLSKCCNQNLHTGNHWVYRMFSNNNHRHHNNNNNNINNTVVPPSPSPSSPGSAKSVTFDTASPQQFPRHRQQPVTPTSSRREIEQQPIKPILRPLTPQSPRKHAQDVDQGRNREPTHEFRVRAPALVRQHSEPEHHKGMGACFSMRHSGPEGDVYSAKPPLPVKPPHLSAMNGHGMTNGHEHSDSTLRRNQRPTDRAKPNFNNDTVNHKPPRPPSNDSRDHNDHHVQVTRQVPPSPIHGSRTFPPPPPPPAPKETHVMVAESKHIVPPHPVTATSVNGHVTLDRRHSEDRSYDQRNGKALNSWDAGSFRNSEEQNVVEKYATISRSKPVHVHAEPRESLENGYPPQPRNNTSQKYIDPYHESNDRDTLSIASLSQRQSRSRANIDHRDSQSVKSFGEQNYNGYGRKGTPTGRGGTMRYRPHIHKGMMYAQMQARRSVEIPAPCLKESSV